MTPNPTSSKTVRVAIGAVVDNVSSINDPNPTPDSTTSRHHHDPHALRVLITKRKSQQVLGGRWELPGGKIEPDESPQDAVIRELFEEVGIHVQPTQPLPAVEHTYDHAHIVLLPFICRRVAGLPRPIEVQDVRWARLDQLPDHDFPEASLPVIAALTDLLTRTKNCPDTPRGKILKHPD